MSSRWGRLRDSRVGSLVRHNLPAKTFHAAALRLIGGLALFYAWNLTSTFVTPIVAVEAHGVELAPMYAVSTSCYEVTLVLIALVFSRLGQASFRGVTRVVAVSAGLAMLALALVPDGGILGAEVAVLVFRGVGRVAAAFVIVAWGVEYCRLDGHTITVCTLSGFLLALVGFLVLSSVPLAVRGVAFALLLPCSVALLHLDPDAGEPCVGDVPQGGLGQGVPGERRGYRAFVSSTWRLLSVFFLFGIVEWIVMLNARGASAGAWGGNVSVVIAIGSIAIIGILLVAALSSGGLLTVTYVYKVVIPLVFLGVIFVAALSSDPLVGLMFMSVGYTCFDLFCFVTVAETCGRTGTRPGAAFAWFRALVGVTPGCAMLISSASQAWGFASDNVLLLLTGAIGILVLATSLLLGEGGIIVPEDASAGGDVPNPKADMLAFAERCERAIDLYGIAPREAEVMSLIVRGRSVPYIAERLSLSRSTVKTYVARVYQKMAVGDRQEMIDAIEEIELGRDG